MINWEAMFANKSVHDQVSIFNKTLINVFLNFIPNKTVVFDDKDLPWVNEILENKIKWKNEI